MSYCRFLEADAYIYDDIHYGLYCCACSLMPLRKVDMSIFLGEEDDGKWVVNEGFAAGYDYDKMLGHIAEHRAKGDYIPEHVDERLTFERDCEHSWEEKNEKNNYCIFCWKIREE